MAPSVWDVLIVGGGPAGLTAGYYLAAHGRRVLLCDPRVPFEKPCGGGLTPRVWDFLPVSSESFATLRRIDTLEFRMDGVPVRTVRLRRPLSIVSRKELGTRLLEAYRRVGGVFRARAVTDFMHDGTYWRVCLGDADWTRARFLIFADGVYGISRRRFGHFVDAHHWTRTVGYLIPGSTDRVVIEFWPHLDGYAWIFPRADATSVGICDVVGRHAPSVTARLDAWSRSLGWNPEDAVQRYGYLIPSPKCARGWPPLMGTHWARVGDASGFVDPITREGIVHAVEGGYRLAMSLCRDRYPDAWVTWLEQTRGPEWRSAMRWRRWFFRPGILRTVLRALRHPRYVRVMEGLISGEVSYHRLWTEIP